MHHRQYLQDVLYRAVIPLGIALALAFPAQAQVKPMLDPQILPYQLAGSMSGSIQIAGSDTEAIDGILGKGPAPTLSRADHQNRKRGV